jgi:putative oxidoreductase
MKPLIEKLIAAYDAIVSKFSRPQDILLLLIRIAWGFAFFQAGWGKFGRLKDVGEFFAGLGIPAPEFNAALVASVETVGGLMLVLGLFSRLAAVPLAFNMVVAYLTAHTDEVKKLFTEDWTEFLEADPGPYLLASLIILRPRASLDR